ncbi:hypothetical protein M8013_16245 [Enterobacteriaceae bacterium H4N4]|uniref:PepSY domain-containing protein n=1 Tax=Silvania confinis TaxID=2926470 RepID=A0A9J6QPZ7_9ENTR|nr:hypothetical protein [Silvania confinis]MCU6670293.1 hypothetical protein [Silvania confinis]
MFKKLIISVVLSSFVAAPAFAISANYRAQLERSGCTQVSEADGTCNIHKTKAENQKAAKASTKGAQSELESFLRDSVRGQKTDAAYNALEGYGFQNTQPLIWVKGKQKVTLKVNGADVVTSATSSH